MKKNPNLKPQMGLALLFNFEQITFDLEQKSQHLILFLFAIVMYMFA